MAGFLYFKPNHNAGITRQHIVDWKLGYALPGSVHKTLCMGRTPTKGNGVVFADRTRQPDGTVKMDMDAQQWRKIPHSDVWVGMWKDNKPTPGDLAKLPLMAGYGVKLADDQLWQIPLVRRFDKVQLSTISTLPCYMECDDDGNWHRGPVLDVHAHLWDVTQPIADALLAEYVKGQETPIADAILFKAVCTLLAANYRVGPGELSLMRALTNEVNVHAACTAACDWPTFLEWSEEQLSEQKKSNEVAAGSSMSDGEQD